MSAAAASKQVPLMSRCQAPPASTPAQPASGAASSAQEPLGMRLAWKAQSTRKKQLAGQGSAQKASGRTSRVERTAK